MSDLESLRARALALALRAKAASRLLAASTAKLRTEALRQLAAELDTPRVRGELGLATAKDVKVARAHGQTAALIDRLVLDDARMKRLAQAVREIAAQPDPVGEVTERSTRPNGLVVERVRAPLGCVLMIYEARPNVTAEAAALCVRAGNAVLLRGGSEASESNEVLVEAVRRALQSAGLPEDAVQRVPPERALLEPLLLLDEHIDLCIPRGGPSLIRFIAEKSRIPVIKHYQGVCHLYVAADADVGVAARLALNGKAQRPGVCNALECVLVDVQVAARFLPFAARALVSAGVELRCDARALPLAAFGQEGKAGGENAQSEESEESEEKGIEALRRETGVKRAAEGGAVVQAQDDDYGREFLGPKLLVCVVDGPDAALAHIARHGSKHTESICTTSDELAERFVREVDASCTVVNASTRFNDGGELGLGAEIGISTSKLHAYGPMGARELTCTRFVLRGKGQVRT